MTWWKILFYVAELWWIWLIPAGLFGALKLFLNSITPV